MIPRQFFARICDLACLAYFGLANLGLLWDLGCGLCGFSGFVNFAYFFDRSVLLPTLMLFGLAWLLSPNFEPSRLYSWRLARRTPFWAVLCGHFLLLSCIALKKHAALLSNGCDLGIFENVLWNCLHGDFLYSSILARHFWGEHFSLILLPLLPLYRLWESPQTLLIVQSAALSLGAWPIFLMARQRLGLAPAWVLGLAYFAYAPLYGAGLFDFHPVALSVPLLGFSLYYFLNGKDVKFYVFLGAALTCQEEIALIGLGFALLMLWRRRYLTGLILALSAALLFILEVKFIIPHFRGAPFHFIDRYSHLGANFSEIFLTLATRPLYVLSSIFTQGKLHYLYSIFFPLAFLPLLRPDILLPALPILARIVLSNQPVQHSLEFHFSAPLIPFVFLAAILTLQALLKHDLKFPAGKKTITDRTLLCVLISLCTFASQIDPFWYVAKYAPEARVEAFKKLAGQIPPQAAVSAMNRLAAHFAARREINIYPKLDSSEYVILDFGRDKFEYPLHPEPLTASVLELCKQGWSLLQVEQGYVLLRKAQACQPEMLRRFIEDAALTFHMIEDSFGPYAGDDEYAALLAESYAPGSFQTTVGRFLPPGDYEAILRLNSRQAATCLAAAHRSYGEYAGDVWLGEGQAELVRPGKSELKFVLHNPDYNFLSLMLMQCPSSQVRMVGARLRPLFEASEFSRRFTQLPEDKPTE